MKKNLLFIIALLISAVTFGQSDYSRGFENGYKEGYCYGDFGCISPIPPVTPIPLIGENYDNYQDGYNRGFKMGLEDKQSKKSNSGGYQGRQGTYQPQEYHSTYAPYPIDAMMKLGAVLQDRIDNNRDYRDKLIEWIVEIKNKTNDVDFLNSINRQYQNLRNMDDDALSRYESRQTLDNIKFSISDEIEKLNTRQAEIPKKLWERGTANMKSNNYNNAIGDFTELLNYNEKCMQCYFIRGMAYYNVKNFNASIKDLNLFIDSKNDYGDAFNFRGWSKYYLNDFVGALSDFNKEVELEPNSPYPYYNRGAAKSKLNDYYGAIADYSKATEIKPDFSMAYNNIAWTKFNQKNYKSGLIEADKSIAIDSNNDNAYDTRGCLYFGLMNYTAATKDFNKAIELNPKSDNSYLYRGRCYFKLGKKKEACEDWSKAGELGKSEAYEFISKYCK